MAVPTTTGTGSESTTICVLDVLSLHVKTGISHPALRPTLAVVDPTLTMTQPTLVTAAAGMDILCHALESYTARWYADFDAKQPRAAGALLRRQPDRGHVVGEGAEPAGRGLPRRRCATAPTRPAREQMALAATFAGLGFGNAGVHIPHANAYPIAGRVRDYRPAGYPDEPMVPHGMAVSLTAPEAFRFTFDAAPERHLHAARLLDPRGRRRPGRAAGRARDADARHRHPQRPGRDRVRRGRRAGSRGGRRSSSSGCWRPLRGVPRRRTWRRSSVGRWNTGDVTQTPPDLVAALRRRGISDVDDSTLTRALYSSDASLYRVVPQVVVRPRHPDELSAILDVSRETGAPVTMRGAGTSIAGNAVGTGIVVDTLKHLNRVVSIDAGGAHRRRAARRRARRPAARGGAVRPALRPGPVDPHPLHDRRDDRQQRLWLPGAGLRPHVGQRGRPGRRVRRRAPADVDGAARRPWSTSTSAHVRTSFGRFTRQVSGYSLEHLLPENGRNVERFLVGSEGTLAVVARATVRLVEDDPDRHLVVLGYPSMAEAADAVPALLAAAPTPDDRVRGPRLADRRPGARARRSCRAAPGWLFVEVPRRPRPPRWSPRPARSRTGWSRTRPRPPRCGGSARTAPAWPRRSLSRPAYSGWEDAAVPPERLGAWLRDFDELLREHDLDGVPYGHFGDGCVHVRIDFPFT